jgi:hypothetical protein
MAGLPLVAASAEEAAQVQDGGGGGREEGEALLRLQDKIRQLKVSLSFIFTSMRRPGPKIPSSYRKYFIEPSHGDDWNQLAFS